MSETNLLEARIAKLVKDLSERLLSVEKGYAQLATESSELKERLQDLDKSSDPTNELGDFKKLNQNDVLKITEKNDRLFLEHSTFQREEWLEAFSSFLRSYIKTDRYEDWVKTGVECQVLPLLAGAGNLAS